MYSTDIKDYRKFYVDAWSAYKAGSSLTQNQRLVAEVIRDHPEHHGLFESLEVALNHQSPPNQQSPFVHLSLHVVVREQVQGNMPVGISTLYQEKYMALKDAHQAEHVLMTALAKTLAVQSPANGLDAAAYFKAIKEAL